MREVALHNLYRLKTRQASVMVKGVMDHPERIRTLDNPHGMKMNYPIDDKNLSLTELSTRHPQARQELENMIVTFNGENDYHDSKPFMYPVFLVNDVVVHFLVDSGLTYPSALIY